HKRLATVSLEPSRATGAMTRLRMELTRFEGHAATICTWTTASKVAVRRSGAGREPVTPLPPGTTDHEVRPPSGLGGHGADGACPRELRSDLRRHWSDAGGEATGGPSP